MVIYGYCRRLCLSTFIINNSEFSFPLQTLESITETRWFKTGVTYLKAWISVDNLKTPDPEETNNTPVREGTRGSPEGAEKAELNKSISVPIIPDNISKSLDTEDKMDRRGNWENDDWRTRRSSRDEERDSYYYDYDSRDSYPDRGEFHQHSKRGRNRNKDKPRPGSSSSDYRSERDGYGTDNSTSSEPPPNDRKNSQKSDKPFVKEPKKDNRESTDGAVPKPKTIDKSQPNSQNSNKSKTEPQTIQTQSISKDEKKSDNLITPKKDNSGPKTEISKRLIQLRKAQMLKITHKKKFKIKNPMLLNFP